MATPRPLISADAWSRWWNRTSQIAGLGLIVYESVFAHPAQFDVLLFAAALSLGGAGIRILLRGASTLLDDDSDDHGNDARK